MRIHHTLRETKQYSKAYLDNLCMHYAKAKAEAAGIDAVTRYMCKQDTRGVPSIMFTRADGCVSYPQEHFASNAEMVAYMRGYLNSHTEQKG